MKSLIMLVIVMMMFSGFSYEVEIDQKIRQHKSTIMKLKNRISALNGAVAGLIDIKESKVKAEVARIDAEAKEKEEKGFFGLGPKKK